MKLYYFQPWILLFVLLTRLSNFGFAFADKSRGKSLSVKRILSELRDIQKQGISFDVPFNNSTEECGVRLSPLANNLLEWHFSFTGVADSNFENGIYHGKISLDPEYPRKAPSICVLTPNGRWEVGKPICLSASSYHQETWDPNWNLRTLVMALRGHMLTQPREIGGISTDPDIQKKLALRSIGWECRKCKVCHTMLSSTLNQCESSSQMLFSSGIDSNLLQPPRLNAISQAMRTAKKRNVEALRKYERRQKHKKLMRFMSVIAFSVAFYLFAMHTWLSRTGVKGIYGAGPFS